jgi:cytochrome c553
MPTRVTLRFISIKLLLFAATVAAARAADAPAGAMTERHRDFLKTNCQGCHGPEKQKGKFRVDDLPLALTDLPTAERWQKILNALNAGEMPPEEEPQPAPDAKANFLDDLSNAMVAARKRLADQKGVIALRRLNRREYANTLRDLLGVHVDVSALPSDTGGSNFDTVGASLFVNGNQFEIYEALAHEALEEAFNASAVGSAPKKFRLEAEQSHPAFLKKNKESLEAIDRMNRWIKAVDDAAARPENAALVARLRQDAPADDDLRFHWHRIPGAPSPMTYGFSKETEVNPRIIYRHRDYVDFLRYDEYYLRLPALERGAYLPVRSNSQPFGFGGTGLATEPRLAIPRDFPAGDYVVRICAGAAPGAPAERRFLDFGLKGAFVAGPGTPAGGDRNPFHPHPGQRRAEPPPALRSRAGLHESREIPAAVPGGGPAERARARSRDLDRLDGDRARAGLSRDHGARTPRAGSPARCSGGGRSAGKTPERARAVCAGGLPRNPRARRTGGSPAAALLLAPRDRRHASRRPQAGAGRRAYVAPLSLPRRTRGRRRAPSARRI